jgi:hypothetical protein
MSGITLHTTTAYQKDDYGNIVVPVTEDILRVCKSRADNLGELRGSIRKGKGNLVGYIGQESVERAICGVTREDTYDYDLKCGGYRIEVKSKDRSVPPRPEYECSVAEMNHTQAADYYVFVSVFRPMSGYETAYILGYITPVDYFKRARFMHKGDLDPSNNFVVRADCYNLPIHRLEPITYR